MSRPRKARRLAIQALYQLDALKGEAPGDVHLRQLLETLSDDDEARREAETFVRGAWEFCDQADALLAEASDNWELHRIAAVDRAILRLAVYELKQQTDTAAGVVINEAIEVAKQFSTAESPRFVNGILDAVCRGLQSSEH